MIATVNTMSTTGQYMYMALIDMKFSHMNRPSRNKNKEGNCTG